jgi:hypothetical protein
MAPTPGDLGKLIKSAAEEAFHDVNTPADPPGEGVLEGTQVSTSEPAPTGSQPDGAAPVTEPAMPAVSMEPYFGIDPEGVPAEKWAEILTHLKRQDSTIGRLNQRLASRRRLEAQQDVPVREAATEAYHELVPAQQPQSAPAPQATPGAAAVTNLDPSQVSDQDFVRALGFEPEDMDDKMVAAIGALARETLAMKMQVAQVLSKSEEEEAVKFWNDSLDELESQYDPFPAEWDRTAILQFAIDEGITSPYELYFRLMAQAKAEVEAATKEARQAALVERLRQEQAGGLRPASSVAGGTPDVTETKDLMKAVKQALGAAEQKHGITLADAVRSRQLGSR